ncbi:MAG: endonuclease MutS2 [Chloroflexi bacterium]|nr:endonuclease MutS2 [Chloroflexota bacterium]
MRQRTLDTLELAKILDRLAQYTSFSASRELALSLTPSTERDEVSRLQRETVEGRRLLQLKPNASLGGARDVRDMARRASLGGVLEPMELLDVLSTLTCARSVRAMLVRLRIQLPLLGAIAESITVQEALEREISRCITLKCEVSDDATPILRRLRAEVKVAHLRLVDRLDDMVNSTGLRHLIQEPIVTQREGRYVIPIKADFKGQIKGIVHDQSASGATVFVEPLEAVDLNNRWRELQLEEQREVQRILRALSAAVGAAVEDLDRSVDALADIDLALARARYAEHLDATSPRLIHEESDGARSDGPGHTPLCLDFIRARHPLLGENVVPISVHLGGDFFVLVITGPNTGGKTVALKTVGLLTLMAQCGLQIPVDQGSSLRVFRNVFADIGDEQSIEQSLSTFSSHMTQVMEVLGAADDDSLVLLDELGAGTDPTEGSALARAILQYLVSRSIPTIGTTHYSELKAYAHGTPGVQNASVEFDPVTLAPTYRLAIGLPGRSNAIAIAKRLGLPEEVTDSAITLLDSVETKADRLLAQIQGERDRIAGERRDVERLRGELDALKKQLEDQLQAIEQERQTMMDQTWRQIESEAAAIRARLAAAMEVRSQKPDRTKLVMALNEVKEVQKAAEVKIAERAPSQTQAQLIASPLKLRVGDYVLVKSLGLHGEVVSLPDTRGEVEVHLGSFKLKIRARDLEPSRAAPSPAGFGAARSEIHLVDRSAPPREIEVRGWRVEQVLPVLENFINEACLAGMPEVRVIHGKGTGVLRRVVREQLVQNPLVKSFRTAELKDGGEGVTVVELAV